MLIPIPSSIPPQNFIPPGYPRGHLGIRYLAGGVLRTLVGVGRLNGGRTAIRRFLVEYFWGPGGGPGDPRGAPGDPRGAQGKIIKITPWAPLLGYPKQLKVRLVKRKAASVKMNKTKKKKRKSFVGGPAETPGPPSGGGLLLGQLRPGASQKSKKLKRPEGDNAPPTLVYGGGPQALPGFPWGPPGFPQGPPKNPPNISV